MAVKYVDEFSFPAEAGFTASAGKTMVSGYARGGKVEPVKKGLGGIVKALSPLAAIASGDAPKGIGALGGVAGLLLEDELRKKRNRQPVVAQTTDVVAPTGMRRGGKVGVPVHNRTPMFGKKC